MRQQTPPGEGIRRLCPRGATTAIPRLPGTRVLLVDDNPTQCDQIANRLRESGCSVAQASDGVEALDIIGHATPDLVVSDTLMPGCDGYELCASLQSIRSLSNIPIILTPASAAEEIDRDVALSLGACAFPLRSHDSGELLEAVAATVLRSLGAKQLAR